MAWDRSTRIVSTSFSSTTALDNKLKTVDGDRAPNPKTVAVVDGAVNGDDAVLFIVTIIDSFLRSLFSCRSLLAVQNPILLLSLSLTR
jgi:hypothetical protein